VGGAPTSLISPDKVKEVSAAPDSGRGVAHWRCWPLIFGLALRVFGLLRLRSAHLDYVGPSLSIQPRIVASHPDTPAIAAAPEVERSAV
jgi:hypothetical protein